MPHWGACPPVPRGHSLFDVQITTLGMQMPPGQLASDVQTLLGLLLQTLEVFRHVPARWIVAVQV